MKFAISSLFLALLATSAEAHNVRVKQSRTSHQAHDARGVGNKDSRTNHQAHDVRVSNKKPRIVGGSEVAEGEFPFFATIGDGGCGGSLIGPKVVLTAAHCASVTPNVHVGGIGIGNDEGGGQFANVADRLVHPGYNQQNGDDFDIMLLYLDREIHVDTNKQMAVANFMPSPGTRMTVVGGGVIEDDLNIENPAEAEFVKKVELSMITNELCNSREWNDGGVTEGNLFCAGGEDGLGHCSGDSGGPIFIVDGNTHIQTGVVASSIRCGIATKPGVYAATSSAYDWMVQNICDKGFEGVMCSGGSSSGGGSSSVDCGSDSYNFADSDGYGCDYYEDYPNECDYADEYENDDGCHAGDSCDACD